MFQTIVQEIQRLTPQEQIDLLQILSRSINDVSRQNNGANAFWKHRQLAEHIQQQKVQPATDIASLKGDFWPEEESVDEMLEYIYSQRYEERDESC